MTPSWYCDIRIKPAPLSRPLAAASVAKVLHGAFRQTPGRYALAMPNHQGATHAKLRVFATHKDELTQLIEAIHQAPALERQAEILYPKAIPKDFDGPWHLYRRYRIPSRKAERDPTRPVRLKRIRQAEERELSFFQMSSTSNGGRFRLFWEVVPCQPSDLPNAGPPDSWGLSTTERAVPLPALT